MSTADVPCPPSCGPSPLAPWRGPTSSSRGLWWARPWACHPSPVPSSFPRPVSCWPAPCCSPGLRPDPLLFARQLAAEAVIGTGTGAGATRPEDSGHQPGQASRGGALRRGLQAARQSPSAILALAAVVGAHAVMVGVMSMTPLHLQELVAGPVGDSHASHTAAGDVLVIIGFTISLHIAGMFALSPVLGWLTDKTGRRQTIVLGFAVLVAAVAVAGFGQRSTTAVAVGLVLLGLGLVRRHHRRVHAPGRKRAPGGPRGGPGRFGHADGRGRSGGRRALGTHPQLGGFPGAEPGRRPGCRGCSRRRRHSLLHAKPRNGRTGDGTAAVSGRSGGRSVAD